MKLLLECPNCKVRTVIDNAQDKGYYCDNCYRRYMVVDKNESRKGFWSTLFDWWSWN